MRDFVNYCLDKQLVEVSEDGTVMWKEGAVKGGKSGKSSKHSSKCCGGRDQKQDLSDDYKDYCHQMGTVWPFKIVAKGGK